MLELQFKLEIETEMFKTSRKNRGTANNCGKYFAIKETHIASSDKMTIKFYTRLQCSGVRSYVKNVECIERCASHFNDETLSSKISFATMPRCTEYSTSFEFSVTLFEFWHFIHIKESGC